MKDAVLTEQCRLTCRNIIPVGAVGVGEGGGGGWGRGSSGLELLGRGREGMWNHGGGGLKPYGRDLEPRVCGLESYE